MQAEASLDSQPVAQRSSFSRLSGPLLLAASRGLAVGLQFLLQVVVGNLAGAAALGLLQLFVSWTCMLGEGIARGLPVWAMRRTALQAASGAWSAARNELEWATGQILRLGLGIWLGGAVVLLLIGPTLPADYRVIAVAVLCGAPLFALVRLGAEALKGIGEPLRAITLENLVIPGTILFVCALCAAFGVAPNAPVLTGAGVAGTALALLALRGAAPRDVRPRWRVSAAAVDVDQDRSDIHALWLSGVLSIAFLQLPFLVLPAYASPAEIGVYAVAHKLVNIVTTLLILLAAVFGPAFARAANEASPALLAQLLRRTQLLSCLIFLPLCAVLLLAAAPLAGLFNIPADLFAQCLWILAFGQLFNAVTGLAGVMLNMSGGAVLEMRTLVCTLAVGLLATPLVGALYGVPGLVLLFSAVLAAKNIASFVVAHRFLSRMEQLS